MILKSIKKLANFKFKFFSLVLATIFLQACATSSLKPNLGNTKDPNWFFQAKGKIAMNIQGKNTSANLDWKQDGYNYRVRIFSTFGIGATIEGSPFFVEASIPGRSNMQAASLDYLIQRGLNFPLPLSNMVYWIKGDRAPGSFEWQKSENPTLRQDGWTINYSNYKSVSGFAKNLPHKLDLSYGGIKIKIVIKEWKKI